MQFIDRLTDHSRSLIKYCFLGLLSIVACVSGVLLIFSLMPFILISDKSNSLISSTILSSSYNGPYSTEFNITYILANTDSPVESLRADDMQSIFDEFRFRARSFIRDGLLILSMKKINIIRERDYLQQMMVCDKSHHDFDVAFVIRIRLQYPNHFICQTPICARSLFFLIHKKLHDLSTIIVNRKSGSLLKLSLCSIEALICRFTSMNAALTS